MSQTIPTYETATGKSEKPIVDALLKKYGPFNVSWPLILIENGRAAAYLYEKNDKNGLNLEMNSRPGSRSRLPAFYMDYTGTPRKSVPEAAFLSEFLDARYSCSYEYIVRSPKYSTVDLDYVWYNGRHFRGFELTTFYVNFSDHEKALDLISKMSRRPSWQGAEGPRAFHRIVDSAADLGVEYYMVCANTVSRTVGSALKTNGNVCLFQMTHEQVDLIAGGRPPVKTCFTSFDKFLKWL